MIWLQDFSCGIEDGIRIIGAGLLPLTGPHLYFNEYLLQRFWFCLPGDLNSYLHISHESDLQINIKMSKELFLNIFETVIFSKAKDSPPPTMHILYVNGHQCCFLKGSQFLTILMKAF